tara:strand:+ start:16093 stop:16569 length:477 start_codon:yes stop_codon:yes gene_type:complete
MRKNRQLILNEDNLILEKNNVQVYKESNNTYYFESQANNLNYFFTCDYLESVSALMKIKGMKKFKKLWNIEITDEMRNVVNYGSCLYWLTGGDKEWGMYKTYNIRWDEAIDLFIDQYEDILIIINQNCNTLGEVREQLTKHLNLPTIYEFCLEKGIIK